MKEYVSVQAWFTAKNYRESTKAVYLQYMATICGLLHKTPDQLADVSSTEALAIQVQLVKRMEEELKQKKRSITQRLNALHSFWRANNVQLTDAIMTYEGTPSLQRAVKMREDAVPPRL